MSEPARTTTRSSLLVPCSPEDAPGRETLAAWARSGMRGLVINRPVRLSTTDPAATARFLHLLTEAAGTGLRVYWEGGTGDVPAELLHHLDPPRGDAGPAWPVPPAPLLTLRRGPGFVVVDDLRDARAPRRHTVPDRPYGHLLRAYAAPAAPDPGDRRALAHLAKERLVLALGPGHCLALPVRFAYARV
ncbi:DUF5825 family protein [Streptomyces sp. MNU89]|uniref:DUF5825 family protein n=1 Tax=Streptomyces sp. MNU89 TaxID=2560025 RepID=UPI001E3AEC1C|nr:DUF5825 family protein [Streptomyces sp. MNU89]MCC9743067.1 DUF5825 family protein [Streptomyces sp. MNU89]